MTKPGAGASLETKKSIPAGPTLKDLWRHYVRDQSFSAQPHHLHRLGVCGYLFCLLVIPAIFLMRVLPHLQLSDNTRWIAIFLTLFLVAENFLNYRACLIGHHDGNVVHCSHCQRINPAVVAWQSESDGTGRNCVTCQTEAPARSHHCRLCNQCVMRRHFHCYILCCCIGYRTHGHFLVFCLYSTVGLAMGSLAFAAYTVDAGGGWLALLPPVALLRWVMGSSDATLLLVVFCLYAQLLFLIGAAVYGHLQLLLLLRNQTLSEMGTLDTSFKLGYYDNLRTALGPWRVWPLLLVYPVRTELSSDGCHWQIRNKKN